MATNRKYDPGYIKYGFTLIKKNNTDLPQCVICAEVLAESSCCPAKLKRHLSIKHGNLSAQNEDYFKSREAELKKRRLDNQNPFQKGIQETVETSYLVNLHIAKNKKDHTIVDDDVVLRHTLPVFTGLGRCPIVNWDFCWSSEHFWTGCPSCRPPMTFTRIRTHDLSSESRSS